MTNLCGQEFLTDPFDEGLACPPLGDDGSGPGIPAMTHERYMEWLKALKKLRGVTNQQIADCAQEHLAGPFDECLACPFLGNGCSGPRTTAMTHERYMEWLKALKKLRGVTNQQIADGAGISKATVDDFYAGRRKDIGRITAGLMEDYLIGGAAKWPCAMELSKDKNVVFEDRPETLDALRAKTDEAEALRQQCAEIRGNVDREMERVRAEYEEDVRFYRDQIALLRDQLRRKDRYIDILIETASKGGDLKAVKIDPGKGPQDEL